MGNSSVTLQSVVDYSRTFSEISPVLVTGSYSSQPALTIANQVMTTMLSPKMNWKFNRFMVPPFVTNSWQQDYATSTTTLGWIEHAFIVDVNSTTQPKPVRTLEVVRDLENSSYVVGSPGQICWLPNDQLQYGTWGGPATTIVGPSNPAALTAVTNPLGAVTPPTNFNIQIKDTNNNYQRVTTFGTTGAVQPTWPAASSAAGTNTTDGSVVWTVVDPKGQGFRITPVAPQSGVVYQVNVIGQMRPTRFTTLAAMIEPIPDDFADYFRQGFIAHCYRHSAETKVRGKFENEFNLWMQSMAEARGKSDRERDSAGFYPDRGVMQDGWSSPGPAWPFAY